MQNSLQLDYVNVAKLIVSLQSPRQHTEKQIRQIAQSIESFGFLIPLLIDDQSQVIAGHGRLLAAQKLKMTELPCIAARHLTATQKTAFMIADNKLTENSTWDRKKLADAFSYLIETDIDLDLTLTGFELPEIDILLQDDADQSSSDDALPEIPQSDPVSKLGDLWLLGESHHVLCGDARLPESYITLLGDKKAGVVFTDPPYNVPIQGHVCGSGEIHHDEFVMASGEMTPEAFTTFLGDAFKQLAQFSRNGSIHYICMDWRHITEIMSAAAPCYAELKNLCVWNKTNGGMGSLYRSKHELVFVYKNGTEAHINNVELGKHGRYRTNVWNYAGVNSFSGKTDLLLHPTVKPVEMIADALLDCSNRGDIVLDAFGGSGSTLIAAERTGRKGHLLELEPKYVDVTIERFIKLTGQEVTLAGSGKTFNDIRRERHVA
jgi:DNA modification methylase